MLKAFFGEVADETHRAFRDALLGVLDDEDEGFERTNRAAKKSATAQTATIDARSLAMDCDKCGAHLDLDLDNMLKFCPYCGNKILVDPMAFKDVLLAKEKTKRKAMEYEHEDAIRKENEAKNPGRIRASIILGIIGLVMMLVGGFAGEASGNSNSTWYMLQMLGFFPLLAIGYIWASGSNNK